jgi:hypothetical protein
MKNDAAKSISQTPSVQVRACHHPVHSHDGGARVDDKAIMSSYAMAPFAKAPERTSSHDNQ